MHGEGIEPSHLTIVGLKSTALDHSAIRALNAGSIKNIPYYFKSLLYGTFPYYIPWLSLSSFL
jgi:hypothetical protein